MGWRECGGEEGSGDRGDNTPSEQVRGGKGKGGRDENVEKQEKREKW